MEVPRFKDGLVTSRPLDLPYWTHLDTVWATKGEIVVWVALSSLSPNQLSHPITSRGFHNWPPNLECCYRDWPHMDCGWCYCPQFGWLRGSNGEVHFTTKACMLVTPTVSAITAVVKRFLTHSFENLVDAAHLCKNPGSEACCWWYSKTLLRMKFHKNYTAWNMPSPETLGHSQSH